MHALVHFKFETSQPQLTHPQRKLARAPASATATAEQKYQHRAKQMFNNNSATVGNASATKEKGEDNCCL